MKDSDIHAQLPLTRTWLGDIVQAYLQGNESALEIREVVRRLTHTERNLGETPEQTVTGTIEDYCINSTKFRGGDHRALFERVSPNTYKLLGHPNPPSVINLQRISFSDRAYQHTWDLMNNLIAGEPDKSKIWEAKTNQEKLLTFSRWVDEHGPLRSTLDRERELQKQYSRIEAQLSYPSPDS